MAAINKLFRLKQYAQVVRTVWIYSALKDEYIPTTKQNAMQLINTKYTNSTKFWVNDYELLIRFA